jgi:hypothetical protein
VAVSTNSLLPSPQHAFRMPIAYPIPNKFEFSPLYAGSDGRGMPFNDAIESLDLNWPIREVTISAGWVVDGFRVVYGVQGGGTVTRTHGSFDTEVASTNWHTFYVLEGETICSVRGFTGETFPIYGYGDCIQQIGFEIRNKLTGGVRSVGPFGLAYQLRNGQRIDFTGDLVAFKGREEVRHQVGLRCLSFVTAGGTAYSSN